MNKLNLVKALSQRHQITHEQSARVVDLVFGQMAETLAQGQDVQIRGLCTFKIKHYPGYSGRNPKSGEAVYVRPKKLPFFRAGLELKKRVNNDGAEKRQEITMVCED